MFLFALSESYVVPLLHSEKFMNKKIMVCHWCKRAIKDSYIYIEGFLFCDEICEANFYTDRLDRKKLNKLPLSIERIRNDKIAT